MPPSTPRIYLLKETLSTELKTIIAGDTYFNTVKNVVRGIPNPQKLTLGSDLHVSMEIGTRSYKKKDDTFTAFEVPQIVAWQFVKSIDSSLDDEKKDADLDVERMLEDGVKLLKSITTKYLRDATNPWNVTQEQGPPQAFPYVLTSDNTTKAVVVIQFNIKLRRDS
jgi:hypothetical protein